MDGIPDNFRVRENPQGQLGRYQGKNVTETVIKVRKDELLRDLLSGFTTKECAEKLRLTPFTIRNYIRNEEFQKELKLLSFQVWKRVDEELGTARVNSVQKLSSLSERALERLEELLESDDERVVLRAVDSVLDRNADTSKHHKVENTDIVIKVDPAQLALAAQAAQEIEGRTIEGEK
jgi:hypothetical protein